MATEPDKPNTTILLALVLILTFAMVAGPAALTGLVRSHTDEVKQAHGSYANTADLTAMRTEQRALLTAPATWSDKEEGLVSFPISAAMMQVVDEIQRDPNKATPLPPPPPPEPADAGAGDGASEENAGDEKASEDDSAQRPSEEEPKKEEESAPAEPGGGQ